MRRIRMGHLISKYSQKAILKTIGGDLIEGEWVEDAPTYLEFDGIVNQLSPEEVEYYGGGKYSTQDIKIQAKEGLEGTVMVEDNEGNLVYTEPLQTESVTFKEGLELIWRDSEYEIQDEKSLTDYSDFEVYIAQKQVVE